MAIDPRKIINSPFGLSLANFIGRYTSDRMGQRIAWFIADFISARSSWKLVRAVRSNLWVASGEKLDKEGLDKIVTDNFRNVATSIYDMYHHLYDPASFLKMIEPHPSAVQLVQRPEYCDRGLMVVGVHMSNFDMIFQIGGLAGIKALVLTLPELNAAYQKQLDMRARKGLNIVQASMGSIKQAVNHLKAGGMVITGIDRPDDNNTYRPRFFDRPAAMPIHHIFLALKARVPILVIAMLKQPDGKYHFLFSEPIEMQPHPDRHVEIILNAENILQIAEGFIRHDPSQWAMTFPVWPEAMNLFPR